MIRGAVVRSGSAGSGAADACNEGADAAAECDGAADEDGAAECDGATDEEDADKDSVPNRDGSDDDGAPQREDAGNGGDSAELSLMSGNGAVNVMVTIKRRHIALGQFIPVASGVDRLFWSPFVKVDPVRDPTMLWPYVC